MTVRMLCFSFPAFGMKVSNIGITGGDRRFIEISKRLAKMGVEIGILTTDTGAALYQREGLKNVNLHLIRVPTIFRWIFNITIKFQNLHILTSYIFAPLLAFHKIPKLLYYDIVYSQSDFISDTLLAFLCKIIFQMKWVAITYHIIPNPLQRKGNVIMNILSFISQQISWFLMKKVNLVMICESEEGKRIGQKLKMKGLAEERIVMVKVGVDLNYIHSVTIAKKKDYDACFAAALGPVRGLYDIVPIWERVVKAKKHAKLIVIGKGSPECEKAFNEQVQNSGLQGNIKIASYLTGSPLFNEIKKSKVFLNLYHETGWALAITEAMACGLPVIAYDLPAYNIYEKGIIKVPLVDFDSFAKVVVELLDNDGKRAKLAKEASSMVLPYDITKVTQKELSLLKNIMD